MNLMSYVNDDTFCRWLRINYSRLMRDTNTHDINAIISNLRKFGFSDDAIIRLAKSPHVGRTGTLAFV